MSIIPIFDPPKKIEIHLVRWIGSSKNEGGFESHLFYHIWYCFIRASNTAENNDVALLHVNVCTIFILKNKTSMYYKLIAYQVLY